jgi:hypothetical protein
MFSSAFVHEFWWIWLLMLSQPDHESAEREKALYFFLSASISAESLR